MEQQLHVLRQELKAWEKEFAAEHEGRKAGREDIKADALISQKYKEYNKIRDVMSGKAAPETPSKRRAPRKLIRDTERTPRAQRKATHATPTKTHHDSGVDLSDAAEYKTLLFSPQGPTMIGPTPQRDGIVLGLFDILPMETPSKNKTALAEVGLNVVQTPSKNPAQPESETSFESRVRGERTPLSTGKRYMLDRFATPQKRKREEEGTPTSTLKGFSTPAFLRRHTIMETVNDENEPTPRPAPWKRSFGRSLSSMIRSMKQQEEDRLDEEADIMRELEAEAEAGPAPKKQRVPQILVGDSQVATALDPDGFLPSEESDYDGDEAQGNEPSGRTWKKKGQKRQTRRVIMRPNFVKPKPLSDASAQETRAASDSTIRETQTVPNDIEEDVPYVDEDDESDYASDGSHTPKKRKMAQREATTAITKLGDKTAKAGPVKTVARKIKATAHANYRKLKIKNKGGNGGKGRFGRRR